MREIGGYFELELSGGQSYHPQAIRLNTGRNAFEYILRIRQYRKVYLPYYTCDTMMEPIAKLGLAHEFYHIDRAFSPDFDFSRILSDEVFVYTNYFGVCNTQASAVRAQCANLIIDNSQAFFADPLLNTDTFYSPRKFFGVPDGAYLYTNGDSHIELEQDISHGRFEHLLGRIEVDARRFYPAFLNNDASLGGQPIKKMSYITQRLLESIDYKEVARKRRENFSYLHRTLGTSNGLEFDFDQIAVPMVYPYLAENGDILKKELIDKGVYVATYWPNVARWCNEDQIERFFSSSLLPLPTDQRYGISEMKDIETLIAKLTTRDI